MIENKNALGTVPVQSHWPLQVGNIAGKIIRRFRTRSQFSVYLKEWTSVVLVTLF